MKEEQWTSWSHFMSLDMSMLAWPLCIPVVLGLKAKLPFVRKPGQFHINVRPGVKFNDGLSFGPYDVVDSGP